MFKYNGQQKLEAAKQDKISAVINSYSQQRAALLDELADITERETWAQQFAEAQAYLTATATKKPTIPTPLIDSLIVSRGQGESKEEFAQKIINKNTAYATAIATLLGQQKQAIAKIQAATTIDELEG